MFICVSCGADPMLLTSTGNCELCGEWRECQNKKPPDSPEMRLSRAEERIRELEHELKSCVRQQQLDSAVGMINEIVRNMTPRVTDQDGFTLKCACCGVIVTLPFTDETKQYVALNPARGWSGPPMVCPKCSPKDKPA